MPELPDIDLKLSGVALSDQFNELKDKLNKKPFGDGLIMIAAGPGNSFNKVVIDEMQSMAFLPLPYINFSEVESRLLELNISDLLAVYSFPEFCFKSKPELKVLCRKPFEEIDDGLPYAKKQAQIWAPQYSSKVKRKL